LQSEEADNHGVIVDCVPPDVALQNFRSAEMKLTIHQGVPLAGRKQLTLTPVHLPLHVARNARLVTSCTRPEHRTRHVARVVEQSKSSAEAFIESVQESLRDQRLEVEESVVAADINELQQQVTGLEQQVRYVGVCMGRRCMGQHVECCYSLPLDLAGGQ